MRVVGSSIMSKLSKVTDNIEDITAGEVVLVLIILILLYAIMALLSGKAIVRSKAVDSQISSSDLCYFLPKGMLKITTKVKVEVVTNKETKEFIRMNFLSQTFECADEIIPDRENLIELHYNRNVFSDDTLTLKLSDKGLLESVAVIAEDKSPKIVEELSKAPAIIFTGKEVGVEALRMVEVEKKEEEYIKVFMVDPSDLKASYEWLIQVNKAEPLDVSFIIKNTSEGEEEEIDKSDLKEVKGIYSRPIETSEFIIEPQESSLKSANVSESFMKSLPSLTRLIHHPIERSSFVKKDYTFTLKDGIMTNSVIKKPSEVYGFVSIPINIAKAIVSIPAQLISFKINTVKKQKALEDEIKNLETSVIQRQSNKEIQELAIEKGMIETQKAIVKTNAEIIALKETMMLAEETKALKNEKSLLELAKSIKQLKADIDKIGRKKEQPNSGKN